MIGDAIRDIALERARQLAEEGFGPEHDDAHDKGEMATAAAAYCESALTHPLDLKDWESLVDSHWPHQWDQNWFKPTDPRRDLVKAGALIVAEIERLDRRDKS